MQKRSRNGDPGRRPFVRSAAALADDTEALAKAAQNPIANMISLPFQNNTTLNAGPEKQHAERPQHPAGHSGQLNDDWNLITRTILPVISQPGFVSGRTASTAFGWATPVRAVRLARQAGEARSGASGRSCSFRPIPTRRSAPKMGHRARRWSLLTSEGPLAVRRGGQQRLVVRGTGDAAHDQPDAGPVFRQLQLRGRLVRDDLAGHHRQLEGHQQQPLDGAHRRRIRQDLQDRQARR